ncbi:MAG: CRISPR-associated endonuclease Cas2 [bacterium]|nr:CRISPR-associated endonuclease Cas2 [bacterium]
MYEVLESLSDLPGEIFCGFGAFLAAGYGASAGKFQYEFDRIKRESESSRGSLYALASSEMKKELQNYRVLLSRLKKDDLVKELDGKISRTTKGKAKLSKLKESAAVFPDPKRYKKSSGEKIVIVSFDVPEKQRMKRDWLRSVLQNLGFKKVQQSVFVGKGALPKDFLNDIGKLELSSAVEIFAVDKRGSLRNII